MCDVYLVIASQWHSLIVSHNVHGSAGNGYPHIRPRYLPAQTALGCAFRLLDESVCFAQFHRIDSHLEQSVSGKGKENCGLVRDGVLTTALEGLILPSFGQPATFCSVAQDTSCCDSFQLPRDRDLPDSAAE